MRNECDVNFVKNSNEGNSEGWTMFKKWRRVIIVAGVLVVLFGLWSLMSTPSADYAPTGADMARLTATSLSQSMGMSEAGEDAMMPTASAMMQPQQGQQALPDTGGGGGGMGDGLIVANAMPAQNEPVEQAQSGEETVERIIIRDANLSIVVDDPEARLTAISDMAVEMGGWVINSNVRTYIDSSDKEVAQGTIAVRIPAERLNEALEQIKAGAGRVESENVTGEDVTTQYVDISSRLANLEAAEIQLREILRSAETAEEVLAVFHEQVRIRGDIESLRGQINYFDQASAFSSIRVTINPTPPERVIEISGWSPGDTARDSAQTLVNIGQGLVDLVITLVIVGVPVLLVIGVPVWLIWRRARRMMKKSSA
jgi:hypothetical protein